MSETAKLLTNKDDYYYLIQSMLDLHPDDQLEKVRWLCRNDLFYLLVYGFGRADADKQWLFERCREVQDKPDDMLDLWSREHYKDLCDKTPMLTENRGWTTHGDLRVGDFVYSPDGNAVKVIALSDRYIDSKCYKITFSGGEHIIAGAGHLWRIRQKHTHRIRGTNSRNVLFSDRIVSTEDMLEITGRIDIDESRYVKSIEQVDSVPTRCIQVAGGMYLAGRELIPTHNSTILTYAKTIQDILIDPNITVGIFSHTRPIAKAFLRQIKREFELNQNLKHTFPDILFQNPSKEAIKWSEDDGIVVKRSQNPKESTVEAWGVVDGQPTGKHFSLLVYDDVVTKESVSSPEQIAKTTDSLALSYNLGAHGGRRRFIGTRYHFADTYKVLMERGTVTPRIHAATHDGSMDGRPVFLTEKQLFEKRRDMGSFVYSCQMLQNPVADSSQGFSREWIRQFSGLPPQKCNWYIVVDAANGKRKSNDYTSMWAVGLGVDGNYYCIPEVRDRLNLTERAKRLIALHRKYRPIQVRYERYGMMGDITYIKKVMEEENYRFDIYEVAGATSKADRIKRLVPIAENSKLWIPERHIITNYEGKTVDNVQAFIEEELIPFPVPLHDDMLDALARICDEEGRIPGQDKKIILSLKWPKMQERDEELSARDWRIT